MPTTTPPADLPPLIQSGYFGGDWRAVDPAELQYHLGLSEKTLQALTSKAEGAGGMPRVIIGGVTRFFLPHVRAWLATTYGTGDLPAYRKS